MSILIFMVINFEDKTILGKSDINAKKIFTGKY